MIENAFDSYNYLFFPEKFDQPYILYYFDHYEYFNIVELILGLKEEEIMKEIIHKKKKLFFFMIIIIKY